MYFMEREFTYIVMDKFLKETFKMDKWKDKVFTTMKIVKHIIVEVGIKMKSMGKELILVKNKFMTEVFTMEKDTVKDIMKIRLLIKYFKGNSSMERDKV